MWTDGSVHKISGPPGSPVVPAMKELGRAPGGLIAISNGHDDNFIGTEHVIEGHDLVIGLTGQCVAWARLYCLMRRGFLLPQIHLAAHIAYVTHVWDVEGERWVPARFIRNGTTEKPIPHTMIVYPQSLENFVGHVGVITEVGDDYVCVADQNRFFHHWGDDDHSVKFKLEKTADGRWHIRDPHVECLGWLDAPSMPLRPDDAPPPQVKGLKIAPALSRWRYTTYFARGFWSFEGKWKFVKIFASILARVITRNTWEFFFGGFKKSTFAATASKAEAEEEREKAE